MAVVSEWPTAGTRVLVWSERPPSSTPREPREATVDHVAGRTFTVAKAELKEWIGNRAEAGRLPPKGFPKNNKFEG